MNDNNLWQNKELDMLIINEKEEPPSINTSPDDHGDVKNSAHIDESKTSFITRLLSIFRHKTDPTLRQTIEEYIEDDSNIDDETSTSSHEKTLISNILKLRDLCAADVMIPRADIIGLNHDCSQEDIFALLSEKQYSRLPVYKETLDNVVGCIHVKDILATLSKGESLEIDKLVRDVPIVSPSIHVLDLLLEMRISRKHMALVVDEYGGIDGLITIGDLIEDIVGEIDDEHDPDDHPEIITQSDGTILADARVDLDMFEEQFGEVLTNEERHENDTLGGLVFFLAGRVPARGEVLKHETGMKFEILEADPRRVSRICIRDIPTS